MRRLKGGVPRTFKDHRRKEALLYAAYVRAKQARWNLGPDARTLLRECGLADIELGRLMTEIEEARTKASQKKNLRRLRREQRVLRAQLMAMERRLEELSGQQLDDRADLAQQILRQQKEAHA